MKNFSPESIICLKEALTHIYWKRKDIKTFIYHTIKKKEIIATIDWENSTKDESISILINRMIQKYEYYKDDLLSLFDAILHFSDYSHLERWEDSETKIKKAKNAVAALRKQASGYFQLKEEEERIKKRKELYQEIQKENEITKAKLAALKNSFTKIHMLENPNRRGFAFEVFLNDFFEYYDLDPRRSFKILGEQIDGAFTFENTDYIVEAKWQKKPLNAGDLNKFAGKISNKLKLTMGLFISFNGFSSESLSVDSPGMKSMILMDGADVLAVLDERIKLDELLYRKRRHASETGNIYIKINNIL